MGEQWLIRSKGAPTRGGDVLEYSAWLEVSDDGGRAADALFLADITYVLSGSDLEPAACPGDAFMAVTMLLAMRAGCDLRSELPVSDGFLASAAEAAQVVSVWFPEFQLPRLSAVVQAGSDQRERQRPGVGCFFSGGVDSFFSLQKHREEITHLIFVHGFDVPLERIAHRELSVRGVYAVAEELGMEVIEVATNIRGFGDRIAEWERYGMPVLIGSAHLLSGVLGKVYLPSTLDYRQLKPYVTHPYIDPMWSSAALQIVHDGAEADRGQKIEALAGWDLALRHLRVCWGTNWDLNCGHCEKCIRTMIALDSIGALDRCDVFEAPYEPDRMRGFEMDQIRIRYLGDTLRLAQRCDAREEIVALVAEVYADARGHLLAEEFHAHAAQVVTAENWPQLSRKLRKGVFAHLREHDPEWLINKAKQRMRAMREPLFMVFWRHCKRWMLRTMLSRRFRVKKD